MRHRFPQKRERNASVLQPQRQLVIRCIGQVLLDPQVLVRGLCTSVPQTQLDLAKTGAALVRQLCEGAT